MGWALFLMLYRRGQVFRGSVRSFLIVHFFRCSLFQGDILVVLVGLSLHLLGSVISLRFASLFVKSLCLSGV